MGLPVETYSSSRFTGTAFLCIKASHTVSSKRPMGFPLTLRHPTSGLDTTALSIYSGRSGVSLLGVLGGLSSTHRTFRKFCQSPNWDVSARPALDKQRVVGQSQQPPLVYGFRSGMGDGYRHHTLYPPLSLEDLRLVGGQESLDAMPMDGHAGVESVPTGDQTGEGREGWAYADSQTPLLGYVRE